MEVNTKTKVSTVFGNLQQTDVEIKQTLGWTDGEIKVAKKLANNDWLKTQLRIQNKEIANVWGQVELQGA